MPITHGELEAAITLAFPNGKITIKDLAGDNDHWSVEVIDEAFKALPRVQQHKLVQNAVKQHDIHALQIKTGV